MAMPGDSAVNPRVPVQRTFGIDLGTTYSAISWHDPENRRLVNIELTEAADGAKEIRSVVYYPGPDQPPVVGETAWNQARQFPERVIRLIKLAMGTGYKCPAIDGVEHTPPEVSAEVLKVLVQDARAYVGEEIRDVVITVPAYFGEAERAATLEAGRLAGLNVLQILDEPHAAALAFAIEKASEVMDRHLLVYDLGGGTFDVTLIHAAAVPTTEGIDLKIETLCKEGKRELGGTDWDKAMLQMVADQVMQEHGVDVEQDPRNEAILLDNCERAKRDLGRVSEVTVSAGLSGHQVRITCDDFEDRTRDLLMTTEMLIDIVLEDAKKLDKGVLTEQEQQLDEAEKDRLVKERIEILLVGGASKMPMVRRMLAAKMGKAPLQYGNPNLLVTGGAAYKAHLLQAGETVVIDVIQSDGSKVPQPVGIPDHNIAAHAIGVGVFDEENGTLTLVDDVETPLRNAVLLPKGTKYGDAPVKKLYQTTGEGMTEIVIVLFEGDSPDVNQCNRLMTVRIEGLPAGRSKGQLILVCLGYDKSGVLRGKAFDKATNKEVEIVLDRSRPKGIEMVVDLDETAV